MIIVVAMATPVFGSSIFLPKLSLICHLLSPFVTIKQMLNQYDHICTQM